MSDEKGLPAWVCKRDGRLAAFEPDKISQALFAATETLGQPDSFLARELTDGVLHFLTTEGLAEIPTTGQMADLVIKVVRELGQPALSRAFAAGRERRAAPAAAAAAVEKAGPEKTVQFQFSTTDAPDAVARDCLTAYSLHAIFSRDLAAAHTDGWLTLTGLENPLHLADGVVALRELENAGPSAFGRFAVVDGPEYSGKSWEEIIRCVQGRQTILNVNCAAPPAWAEEKSAGPLFAEPAPPLPTLAKERNEGMVPTELPAEQVLNGVLDRGRLADPVRIAWHLAQRDFQAGSLGHIRLHRLARLALEGAPLDFVFDRPRHPIVLAEGIDRKNPAVLLTVVLHLPRLLTQAGVAGDPQRFLVKLGSLTRMAVSAGVQKRDYLRRHNALVLREFLLDRARLVVQPVGLDAVVQALAGQCIGDGPRALELAQQIVASLAANLRCDGRGANLEGCVDGDFGSAESTLSFHAKLKSAGAFHESAGMGTAVLPLPLDTALSAEVIVDLVNFAWKQTAVVRLRFLRAASQQRHLAW